MAVATVEEANHLRAQLAEVKRQFEDAFWRVGFAGAVTFGLLNVIPGVSTYAQEQVELARKDIGIAEVRYLRWAIAGKRDDGTTYDRALYTLALRDIAVRLNQATDAAWDESIFTAISNIPHDTATTLEQAVEDVKNTVAPFIPTQPEVDRFVFWLKVAVGVTAGVAVLGGVGYAVRSFR